MFWITCCFEKNDFQQFSIKKDDKGLTISDQYLCSKYGKWGFSVHALWQLNELLMISRKKGKNFNQTIPIINLNEILVHFVSLQLVMHEYVTERPKAKYIFHEILSNWVRWVGISLIYVMREYFPCNMIIWYLLNIIV